LPPLPQHLKFLYCANNRLTWLPILPQRLEKIDCSKNQLTLLPIIPPKLQKLDCFDNQLTSLPSLPSILDEFYCHYNPIFAIVYNISLFIIKQNINTLNNFRHLYYCLKFKTQLRKWLWEKVREPKIQIIYNPTNLIRNLDDKTDLDTFLDNW
jgi:Leucine-rich repeat (LRR) protein